MTSRDKKTSIKTPKQERSRQTVDSILESTARILTKEGMEALNTNRIAEVAGVSIGSIYQFFRTKEAILEKLLTSVLNRNLEALNREMDTIHEPSLEGIVRALIDNLFAEFERRGPLIPVLMQNAHRLLGPKHFQKIDEVTIPFFLDRIERAGIRIGPKDPERALFVVIQAMRGVVSMSFARKESRAERTQIKEEMIRMFVGYLEP
jgi:AcrR family transcriptional regulator